MPPTPPTPSAALRPVRGSAAAVLDLLRAWEAAEAAEPLAIETSGSTGRPKRVLLSRAAMRASARATEQRLGGPGQWTLTLPAHYVAGVQVLFRSVLAGTEPVLDPPSLAAAAERSTHERRYLSVVATQLHRLLADPAEAAALSSYSTVLVGGGALDPRDAERAAAAGVRVVRTYGMSETCGGCVYDGVPLDGVRLRIVDGLVQLGGAVLFDGYDDPALTAETMTDDGWLRTHDLGEVVDGRLRVLGRDDDVVNSGGVKVPAPAVARALETHHAVRRAHVLGVPDEEWGQRVVAVVETDAPLTTADLRALDAGVPRTWLPRGVVTVDRLPELPNGKPDLQALRALAQSAESAGSAGSAQSAGERG